MPESGPSHCAEHPARKGVPREPLENGELCRIDRKLLRTSGQNRLRLGKKPCFCEERHRLKPCVQRPFNHQRALGDEKAVFRTLPADQLIFGQAGVNVQRRVFEVRNRNNPSHA